MSKVAEERRAWMAMWCAKRGAALQLEGECGFGRECVGVSVDGVYPDYEWRSDDLRDDFRRLDNNGEVWTPRDAYHKHPCVAVLGRGDRAEKQLYDWLKWFDANGFVLESGSQALPRGADPVISMLLCKHLYARMVRREKP